MFKQTTSHPHKSHVRDTDWARALQRDYLKHIIKMHYVIQIWTSFVNNKCMGFMWKGSFCVNKQTNIVAFLCTYDLWKWTGQSLVKQQLCEQLSVAKAMFYSLTQFYGVFCTVAINMNIITNIHQPIFQFLASVGQGSHHTHI